MTQNTYNKLSAELTKEEMQDVFDYLQLNNADVIYNERKHSFSVYCQGYKINNYETPKQVLSCLVNLCL